MNTLFNGVYKDKTVLVTGHTGFKGSWLCLWLQKMGAKVIGYSLEPLTSPNHFDLLAFKMTSILGDIRDLEKLRTVFDDHQPEIVFHLAAQALVRPSYEQPLETFSVNIMGAATVLEVCRLSTCVKAVINVTTDKCYENNEWHWGYRESDPMGGHDPYSASKGCSELLSASYRNSFGRQNFLIATARAGNVIGGGDWSVDRLVPDMCKGAAVGQTIAIRNPSATRPWQHVLEPLSGYLLLGERLLQGENKVADAWNFGPGDEGVFTVGELAITLKKYWSFNFEISPELKAPHEATLLKLDCSKALSVLNWAPIWSSEKMLEQTALWYKSFYEEEKLLTESQIEEYVAAAISKKVIWTLNDF
jgi:CDP-glucose 4,6-dehydratase